MIIDKIDIKNFKSLKNLAIKKPNPFTVFVGANSSGKSNIFEALEFIHYLDKMDGSEVLRMFGGIKNILNFNSKEGEQFKIEIKFPNNKLFITDEIIYESFKNFSPMILKVKDCDGEESKNNDFEQYSDNFTKLFLQHPQYLKLIIKDNSKLALDAANLVKVLKRILKTKQEEIFDWMQLLIPEFEKIEIRSDELSGSDSLLLYESKTKKPFTKDLISDGTFNILALLTVVFQSDEPQFICIEEAENGINPYAIKELVNFFREQCEEKGHYIWLTSHSETLVDQLKPEEVIVVDKVNGETKIKQFQGENLHGLTMGKAWLSNVLGGGLPW